MGTSRNVCVYVYMCVYLVLMQNMLLYLMFKLIQQYYQVNNVFYQHIVNLE